MRKIRIIVHLSLDGVFQPEGADEYANGGWSAPYRTPEGRQAILAAHGSSLDLLLGRRTYDLFAGFWPKAGNIPMANAFNAATKYVATHRPDGLGWGPVEALGPDLVESVRALKSQAGPDLVVVGSGTVASALLENGLVDEVVTAIYPILFGRGKRYFSTGANPGGLALVSTLSTPAGVLLNTYRPAGAPRTQ
jgi:dihydrofolate reductase